MYISASSKKQGAVKPYMDAANSHFMPHQQPSKQEVFQPILDWYCRRTSELVHSMNQDWVVVSKI